MPFKLVKAPRGLLEFFRLKTDGRNPQTFGEEITPVADITQWYQADQLVNSNSAPTIGALPLADTLVLTDDCGIIVLGGQYIQGAAAGANMILSATIRDQVGGQLVGLGAVNLGALPIGTVIDWGVPIPQKLFLRAGAELIVRAIGTAAGADHSLAAISMISSSRLI